MLNIYVEKERNGSIPVAISAAEAEFDSRDWRVCTVCISTWPWLRFAWIPFARTFAASEVALSGSGSAEMMRGRSVKLRIWKRILICSVLRSI